MELWGLMAPQLRTLRIAALICFASALALGGKPTRSLVHPEAPFCPASVAEGGPPDSVLTRLVRNVCGGSQSEPFRSDEHSRNSGPNEVEWKELRRKQSLGGTRGIISELSGRHDLHYNTTGSRQEARILSNSSSLHEDHAHVFYVPLPVAQTLQHEDSVSLEVIDSYSDSSPDENRWSQSSDWRAWVAPYQEEVPSALCRNHSRLYLQYLARGADWTLQMLDASGKLPDGLLFGNLNVLGSWGACLRVSVTLNETDGWTDERPHFRGRMCGVILVNDPESANLTRFHLPGAVRYGYCLPSSCGADDVAASLNAVLNNTGVKAVMGECHADSDVTTLTTGDVTLVAFLAVVALVVILCTAAVAAKDYRKRLRWPTLRVYQGRAAHQARGISGLIRAFSLQANVKKLLDVRKAPHTIGCIAGLRVLSMAWINLGHTYIIGFLGRPNSGQARLPEVVQSWPMQLIMNGFPAVDTFLLIGGIMFSYSLLKVTKAGRPVGVPQVLLMYLQRYLRLTPVYAVVIWFSATLLHQCGRSMFGNINYLLFGIAGCHKYWWRNILYINNLYPSDTDTCVDQAWYLGLDFQLFILAPVFVLPYTRWPRFGVVWLTSWGVVSVIIPGVITGVLNLPPTLLNLNVHATAPQIQHDFSVYVYNAPWSRASPYIIGLALGILLQETGSGGRQPRLGRALNLLLWLLSAAVALLVLFGMYRYNSDPQAQWTPAVAVSYGALHRPAWALAVGWVVFACATGRGGPVQGLLSHPVWVPLSRLTYTTYLCAMQLQVWYASQDRVAVEFSHAGYVCWFLADLLINVAIGLLLWLCIEAPAAAIQAIWLGGKGRAKKPELTQSQIQAIGFTNYSATDKNPLRQLEGVSTRSTDL